MMRDWGFSLRCGCAFILSLSLVLPAVEPAVQDVLQPFDFQGVTLEEGFLRNQIEDARRYYLAIPDDDLLKPYRERAGLPAPGGVLGGWYKENRFNVFGQIVSGLARLHAATGDPNCAQKANHLVAEWAKCIADDGYFFAAPAPHAPHYIYDKFAWGLLDTHDYCGNKTSLQHLAKITDWAEKNLGRSRPFAPSPEEWYTLSENLYRAYLVTGEERYKDFAQVWEYPQYWEVLAGQGDIFQAVGGDGRRTHYHAYSHVNCLGGAVAGYRARGEPKYLAAATAAFDFLESSQLYATGGYGPDEQLLPMDELAGRVFATHKSFETQCGSWACFKLTRDLIALTGDARYGDWAERLSINGIGSTIPMTVDGRVIYYSDYNVHGGEKRQHPAPWSCCTGTRPQAVAELANLAWFHDARGIYMNLFTPSTVRWNLDGQLVTLRTTTDFPERATVDLRISLQKPGAFDLHVRVPGWLAAPMTAQVNGEPAGLEPDARHWASISRVWKDGDRVRLLLPMSPWVRPINRISKSPFALLVGPTVLVFENVEPAALAGVALPNILGDLRAVEQKPLHFTAACLPDAVVRPFYAVGEGTRYYMHLDPGMGSRIHHTDLAYSGKWNNNGPHHVTTEPGASVEFEFEGKGFRWIGNYYDDAGRASVEIDGRLAGTADQYGPRRGHSFAKTWSDLPMGKHNVRITLLPEANPKSRNRFLNISGIDIVK